MIVYSVKVTIRKAAEKDWIDWMTNHHIKEVMDTKYFIDWKMYRIIIPSTQQDETSYLIEYFTDSIDKYQAYTEKEAIRLQSEHNKKFGGFFSAERTVREQIF